MTGDELAAAFEPIVGAAWVRRDPDALFAYGTDALKKGHPADLVVIPADTRQIAAIARQCHEHAVPLVVRGAGTGYTGGSVPTRGGVVISLERLNRILEIDQENLLAVVEPNVVTGDLQRAVEQVGLFYPPDPAEPRSVGHRWQRRRVRRRPARLQVRYDEALCARARGGAPDREIIRTGSKAVKNVVGYDLTQLLVGSEGTLAIITKVVLRLVPLPPARVTLRASFADVDGAVLAVSELIRRRVVPATLELIDAESLAAVARHLGRGLAPEGTGAVLLLEVDGLASGVREEAERVEEACRVAGATELLRANEQAAREELWRVRRELSHSLKTIAPLKNQSRRRSAARAGAASVRARGAPAQGA